MYNAISRSQIFVLDQDEALKFYTDVLGMSVVMRLPDQRLLRYGDGNCALFLVPDRDPGGLRRALLCHGDAPSGAGAIPAARRPPRSAVMGVVLQSVTRAKAAATPDRA